MSYEVQIIADSIGPNGVRITTFQLKYPRMIHAEFMTHRIFSRNASSTRAIPTAKMIEWIERDPVMPIYWGKNQRGMQATEELSSEDVELANHYWLKARDLAITQVKALMGIGVHKQIASRILEPWAHINVVVTATTFNNFFALRCDKNAMPEIQFLAVRMARAYRDSEPKEVGYGGWHWPFVTDEERLVFDQIRERHKGNWCQTFEVADLDRAIRRLTKLSVARCARVSYLTFDGKEPDPETDIKLHDQLLANGHWSPFEHPAQVQADFQKDRSGNFIGWNQYRQMLRKSVHESFDFARLEEFGERGFIV